MKRIWTILKNMFLTLFSKSGHIMLKGPDGCTVVKIIERSPNFDHKEMMRLYISIAAAHGTIADANLFKSKSYKTTYMNYRIAYITTALNQAGVILAPFTTGDIPWSCFTDHHLKLVNELIPGYLTELDSLNPPPFDTNPYWKQISRYYDIVRRHRRDLLTPTKQGSNHGETSS